MNYWLIPTLLLALALFGLGSLAARRLAANLGFRVLAVVGILASVPAVVFALYYLRVFHEPLWLYELRSLAGTELAASGAGFLAGLLHGRYSARQRFRRIAGRGLFPGVLVLGLLIPYSKPILRPPPWRQLQDRWSDGVCLQTSDSSCGPACAATLLRQVGKSATEKDLARESFTSQSGTENWYLARALRRRGVRVRFWLQPEGNQRLPFPAIAGVRLSTLADSGHFITVLGRVSDGYVIGDPLEGRLVLSNPELQDKYSFTGFFMRLDGSPD